MPLESNQKCFYWNGETMALFGLPHIRLVRLVFSAGTVFFSHNNSTGTVLFSQFQPRFRPANGAIAFKEEENQAGTDTDEFHQTRDKDRVKRMVARKRAGSFMVGATFTLFYFCSTTVVTY